MHADAPAPLGRLRMVLVEDSADDAELLQMQLEDGGLDVDLVRVEDAAALRAALACGADVVVSDLSLPRFTGPEALQVVRAYDPRLPFVFFSGSLDAGTPDQALGADHYVSKDRPHGLPDLIVRAIARARAEAK